jgi:hypothetical protein
LSVGWLEEPNHWEEPGSTLVVVVLLPCRAGWFNQFGRLSTVGCRSYQKLSCRVAESFMSCCCCCCCCCCVCCCCRSAKSNNERQGHF